MLLNIPTDEIFIRLHNMNILDPNIDVNENHKSNIRLYHFTEPKNIPSIKEHGLLSWYELNNRNIDHTPASNGLSRSLDSRYNLQDYVRLSLNQNHPMVYIALRDGRVKNLVYIGINPKVMLTQGALFSNDNATSNRVIINSDISTALRSNSVQAEILIKSHIPAGYIIFPNNL